MKTFDADGELVNNHGPLMNMQMRISLTGRNSSKLPDKSHEPAVHLSRQKAVGHTHNTHIARVRLHKTHNSRHFTAN